MDRLLICGAGEAGAYLAEYFSKQDARVSIIDKQGSLIHALNERLDVRGFEGRVSDPTVLRAAGAETVDALIAVTADDELNMITAQVAQTFFQVPSKFVRLRHRTYLDNRWVALFGDSGLPIDKAFSVEKMLAKQLWHALNTPGVFLDEPLVVSDYHLIGCTPRAGSRLFQMPIADYLATYGEDVLRLAAVLRGEYFVLPTEQFVPRLGDQLFVLTREKDIKQVLTHMRASRQQVSNLLYVGDQLILPTLMQCLDDSPKDYTLQVVDRRSEVIERTLNAQGDVRGVCSDITQDYSRLIKLIYESDAILLMTHQSELNTLIAMLTRDTDQEKLTCSYMGIARQNLYAITKKYVDVPVAPGDALLNAILPDLRYGGLSSVFALGSGAGEVWEYEVRKHSALEDLPASILLKRMPSETRLVAILRNKRFLKNTPDRDNLRIGDVLVFAGTASSVVQLEKMLLGR